MKKFIILFFGYTLSGFASTFTVSGISSGGYFAHQFHVANSSLVSGAGVVAGGPYYCAKADIIQATNRCMNIFMGVPAVQDLLDFAQEQVTLGKLDPLDHLKTGKALVFIGKKDKTVDPKVGRALVDFYQKVGVTGSALKVVDHLDAGHAWPTLNYGNECSVASKTPFISKCNYDLSGEILKHLLGPLKAPVGAQVSRIFTFKQSSNERELEKISMGSTGYAYIPQGCENKISSCPLHVAFHGCKQTIEDIGQTFIQENGLNTWAESNGIVVLYPQAKRNPQVGNPNGCWDWWGYLGKDYATQDGAQMKAVLKLIESFRDGTLKLQSRREALK